MNDLDPKNLDEKLLDYAFSMLGREDEYDTGLADLQRARKQTEVHEVEAAIDYKIDNRFCSNCMELKFYDSHQKTYYCPVCG